MQFFEDLDTEVYLEYPLFTTGSSQTSRMAKLEVRLRNFSIRKSSKFRSEDSDVVIPKMLSVGYHDGSNPK